MTDDLIFRLRERARIRRSIPTRKSVQAGEPDRIADLLDEAANAIQGNVRWKVVPMALNLAAAITADVIYQPGSPTAPALYLIIFLNIISLFVLMHRKVML